MISTLELYYSIRPVGNLAIPISTGNSKMASHPDDRSIKVVSWSVNGVDIKWSQAKWIIDKTSRKLVDFEMVLTF